MSVAGKPLTAKQQAIWDLFRPIEQGGQGKKKQDIASILEISVNVVSKTLTVIRKKLGVKANTSDANLTENKKPAAAAAAIDAMTDPYQGIQDAMTASGLPEVTIRALMKRLRVKYQNVVSEVRNLQTGELSEIIGKKIHLLSLYLDDKVASEASARDLAMAMAQLTEKRQLLRGEPTAIVSDHERAQLNELLPFLAAEARRRGVTLDGESHRVDNNAPSVVNPEPAS